MTTAFCLAGLAYGDEGKGATTDLICRTRDVKLVVRYNGGSQCAHNVCTDDGRHHTFAQFGSGTFVPGVRTHLSRFMLINPLNMMVEEQHLRELGITDAWERTTIDEKALIITPFHKELNRLTNHGHNSCGQGVGVCREMYFLYGDDMALCAGDLRDEAITKRKLKFVADLALELLADADVTRFKDLFGGDDPIEVCWNHYKDWPAQIVPSSHLRTLFQNDNVVFEGAQGVLLDEVHGEQGYNTWTNTTFENALTLLAESRWQGRIRKIGVLRTYLTRHGDGPFRTEDPKLDRLAEPHNEDDGYQGKFRRGHFDAKLIRQAIDICDGVDGIALNHCDQIEYIPRSGMSEDVGVNILIRGYGPTANDRHWAERRSA